MYPKLYTLNLKAICGYHDAEHGPLAILAQQAVASLSFHPTATLRGSGLGIRIYSRVSGLGFRPLCVAFQLTSMMHISMLSGEELTQIPVEELSDVAALKRRLNQAHGLPPRFRQRLLFQGNPLDDATKLSSPMNLEIVLLTFVGASQNLGDEMNPKRVYGSYDLNKNYSSTGYCGPNFKVRFVPKEGGR